VRGGVQTSIWPSGLLLRGAFPFLSPRPVPNPPVFIVLPSPYFDDCSAIIFVAAVSSFDQYLREDPSVNRLYDALQLFESICNHRLLRSTSIILFLNKIDVLKRKLANGTRLSHYFKDYTGALVPTEMGGD
jgi:G-protein alpha subunit